jgi:hypothetical protein
MTTPQRVQQRRIKDPATRDHSGSRPRAARTPRGLVTSKCCEWKRDHLPVRNLRRSEKVCGLRNASGGHTVLQCSAPTCSQACPPSGPEDDTSPPRRVGLWSCCPDRSPDRRRPLEQPPQDLALQPRSPRGFCASRHFSFPGLPRSSPLSTAAYTLSVTTTRHISVSLEIFMASALLMLLVGRGWRVESLSPRTPKRSSRSSGRGSTD